MTPTAPDLELDPTDLTARHMILALAAGSVGGALFAWMGAPLAWMLGAMAATTLLSAVNAPIGIYPAPRSAMIAVLGVMLGSAFTPAIAANALSWTLPALFMTLILLVLGAGAYWMFRRLGRLDPVSAYFASVPGGFTEMTLMGGSMGGDMRAMTLAHATRILLVVSIVPFYFRFVMGLEVPTLPANMESVVDVGLNDGIFLLLCAVLGIPIGHVLRLPAAVLVGPMILSSLGHAIGWIEAGPPRELVALAQIVVGASIGCRFAGQDWRAARRIVLVSALATLYMIAVAALAGLSAAPLFDLEPEILVLAISPGGLAEMALVALSLGIGTAFVSTMHLIRIVIVLFAAPVIARLAIKTEAQ